MWQELIQLEERKTIEKGRTQYVLWKVLQLVVGDLWLINAVCGLDGGDDDDDNNVNFLG